MPRQRDWLGTEGIIAAVNGTHQVSNVLPTSVINKGDTLVRIRGSVLLHTDSASANEVVTACGLIFATENQTLASIPDPSVDTDADWLWHSWFTLYAEGDALLFPWARVEVDNRSMRKVASGVQQLLFVASATDILVVGIHAAFGFRILRLLP